MKLQLYVAVSALAIFATSCSKKEMTPNDHISSNPSGQLQYSTNVVVFDLSGQHSITFKVQSNDADVLNTATAELESSTLQLQFDSDGGAGTTTPGVPDISSAQNNAVFVTEIEHNIGAATGYSIRKGN